MNLKKKIGAITVAAIIGLLPTASISASDQRQLTDAQKRYFLKYYQLALEESVGHNVPWQIAMAQGILESGAGTTPNAVNNHNHHGITDGNGGYKYFDSDREGWEGYFENIDSTKVYSDHGAHEAVDPMDYVDAIQQAGYAEDPLYRDKIESLYNAIEDYRIELGILTTEEYAEHLELEALDEWPTKERALIQNELLRLYKSQVEEKIESGELQPGRAGIENVKSIYLAEAFSLLMEPHDGDLASITSREILDIG